MVTVENEPIKENEEFKTVTCTVYDGFTDSWYTHTYSCFFCWGGSNNACLADAVKTLQIEL